MKVTLVQANLRWQDPTANLQYFDKMLGSFHEETQLIVLPEMFTTGFTMEPEKHAGKADGPWLDWMIKTATGENAVVTGSLSVQEGEKFYNRLYWVRPDGSHSFYNKRHLFSMAREDRHYTSGNKRLITQIGDWNMCPLICYDLRFPVWSRNRYESTTARGSGKYEYDVLLYVANWPSVRKTAWRQLLVARAIENQCYVIGVNRVGKDGEGIDHDGESVVLDYLGQELLQFGSAEGIRSVTFNKDLLNGYRSRFPAGADADKFHIDI